MTLLAEDVEARVERGLEALRREFPEQADDVDELGRAHFERLRAGARIEDFLPVLVYRFTREDLGRPIGAVTRRPIVSPVP